MMNEFVDASDRIKFENLKYGICYCSNILVVFFLPEWQNIAPLVKILIAAERFISTEK